MSTRIVTISHAWGAGGENIGRTVAQSLGFRYVDEEIITIAAEKQGLDTSVVADVERKKGLLARIIEDLASAPVPDAANVGLLVPEAMMPARPEDFRALIMDAIRETAEHGDVVIVAHAASIPLAGRGDLLRILITGSFDARVARVAASAQGDKAKATKLLKDSDAARADYFKRFYRIERELPTHYDLVVNTDALALDEAAAIIVAAARRHA